MKQRRVAAADDQADARKDVAPRGQPAGVDVAFNVVDAEQRHAQANGEHLGRADADQQGADQARRMMHGDAADLIQTHAGLAQRFVDDRQQSLQMCPRRDLRHDAAEARVQIGLRRDDVGQDRRLVGEDGRGGFVAGGFDAEEKQENSPQRTQRTSEERELTRPSSFPASRFSFVSFVTLW